MFSATMDDYQNFGLYADLLTDDPAKFRSVYNALAGSTGKVDALRYNYSSQLLDYSQSVRGADGWALIGTFGGDIGFVVDATRRVASGDFSDVAQEIAIGYALGKVLVGASWGVGKLLGSGNGVKPLVDQAVPPPHVPDQVPPPAVTHSGVLVEGGIVNSRVNLAAGPTRFTPLRGTGARVSAGFDHVLDGHFNRAVSANRSVFEIYPGELRQILQSDIVVKAPVYSIPGGQYVRVVDVGRDVGTSSLKDGGVRTSMIKVFTDRAGNLITAYPVKGVN